MIKVVVIGSGNVAQHLTYAFENAVTTELVQVFSRKKETISKLPNFHEITNDFNEIKEADLYVIAVSDDAVAEVASQLPFKNRLVVHTSGSVAMEALPDDNRKGVFYPLQTFSKSKEVDFKNIPVCLEAEFTGDFVTIDLAAKAISEKAMSINSQQRKSLHVAAVFVNNFVNHLYTLGAEICKENQVPFEILKPLILETADKVMQLSPTDAQTGPAKRHDSSTIATHLDFLSDENLNNIYKILTKSIQQHVEKL